MLTTMLDEKEFSSLYRIRALAHELISGLVALWMMRPRGTARRRCLSWTCGLSSGNLRMRAPATDVPGSASISQRALTGGDNHGKRPRHGSRAPGFHAHRRERADSARAGDSAARRRGADGGRAVEDRHGRCWP